MRSVPRFFPGLFGLTSYSRYSPRGSRPSRLPNTRPPTYPGNGSPFRFWISARTSRAFSGTWASRVARLDGSAAVPCPAAAGGRACQKRNRTRTPRATVRAMARWRQPCITYALSSPALFLSSLASLTPSPRPQLVDVVVDVVQPILEAIEAGRELDDLALRFPVHREVELAAQAVLRILSVLAHHDDRRLHGSQHGQHQVEQNERIGIPRPTREHQIHPHPRHEDHTEGDDEGPGAAEARDTVGQSIPHRQLLGDHLVGVAGRPRTDQLLGRLEVAADGGEHVEAGQRLALQKVGEVVAIDLDGRGVLDRRRRGGVRRRSQHRGDAKHLPGRRSVENDFLVVLIDDGHLHLPLHHDERFAAGVAALVDAMSRGESSELDLLGQYCPLIRVEQREDGNFLEDGRIARHRASPPGPMMPDAALPRAIAPSRPACRVAPDDPHRQTDTPRQRRRTTRIPAPVRAG